MCTVNQRMWFLRYFRVGYNVLLTALLLHRDSVTSIDPCKDDVPEKHTCLRSDEQRHKVEGNISSPFYPGRYPENACTNWFISSNNVTDVITISFDDLDIQNGTGGKCDQDWLVIGPKPCKVFCGSLHRYPWVYISKRNHAWLKFHSNDYIVGRGFRLEYVIGAPKVSRCPGRSYRQFHCGSGSGKCIPERWRCNGARECEDGSDERNCLSIKPLSTPKPYDCGPRKRGCWTSVNRKFECLEEYYWCNGRKDCMDGQDEDHCEHKKTCGGMKLGSHGVIQSPNFPNLYPRNTTCEWNIQVKYGAKIQLRFGTFQLEGNIKTDYVNVYDGGSADADLYGSYYGEKPPPKVIESTENRLFVVFHSNKNNQEIGFNATYQQKGACLVHQSPCGYNEIDCYDNKERCNGIWDCPLHGGDERKCGGCEENMFRCVHAANGKKYCYTEAQRCNGKKDCPQHEDEIECTSARCGPKNGTFLCGDKKCIYEFWLCDGQNDCDDGSDEVNCLALPSRRVILAAVIGSLICGLLLVIALGCTCKLYALRLQEQYGGPRFETPMSRLQRELFMIRQAPPTYTEAMVTSRPFDEVQREFMEQVQENSAASGRRRNRSNRGRPDGETADRNENSNGGTIANNGIINEGFTGCGGEQSPSAPSSNPQHQTSPHFIPPTTTSESEQDSDSNCDGTEVSSLNISIATGVSAQWRRTRGKNSRGSNGGSAPQNMDDSHQSSCDLGEKPSEEGEIRQVAPDSCSIDTASGSNDSVLISMSEDPDKEVKTETDDELLLTEHAQTPCLADSGTLNRTLHGCEGSEESSLSSGSVDTSFHILHSTRSHESLSSGSEHDFGDSQALLPK